MSNSKYYESLFDRLLRVKNLSLGILLLIPIFSIPFFFFVKDKFLFGFMEGICFSIIFQSIFYYFYFQRFWKKELKELKEQTAELSKELNKAGGQKHGNNKR